MDGCELYSIAVQGRLDSTQANLLDGMTMTVDSARGATTIVGRVASQSALIGMLNRLFSMRLILLSVYCLDNEHAQPDPPQ